MVDRNFGVFFPILGNIIIDACFHKRKCLSVTHELIMLLDSNFLSQFLKQFLPIPSNPGALLFGSFLIKF